VQLVATKRAKRPWTFFVMLVEVSAGAGTIPEGCLSRNGLSVCCSYNERDAARSTHGSSSNFDWLTWKRNKTSGSTSSMAFCGSEGAVRYVAAKEMSLGWEGVSFGLP
jgi:galactose mutarotase-like enzyme